MVQVDESKPGRKVICDTIDHWSLILSPTLFVIANIYLIVIRNDHWTAFRKD